MNFRLTVPVCVAIISVSLLGVQALAKPAKGSSPTYEYMFFDRGSASRAADETNKQTLLGWEYVESYIRDGDAYAVVLRRPRKE